MVYVTYEDETTENVANTDSLTKKEADQYRQNWEMWRMKKVKIVGLYSRNMEKCFVEFFYDN